MELTSYFTDKGHVLQPVISGDSRYSKSTHLLRNLMLIWDNDLFLHFALCSWKMRLHF